MQHHETELTALQGSGCHIGSRGESVVVALFDELRERHAIEAQQLQQLGVEVSSARLNRSRLYLDDEQRQAAMAASRKHLEAHAEWLGLGEGSRALQLEDLRPRVALQHFTAVDVEDLELPEEARRSCDRFTEDGVAEQFLLDSCRSVFILAGEELNFVTDMEACCANREEDPVAVERLQRDFEQRLVAALIRALGGKPAKAMVQSISRAMSQSGMANMERACKGPQIVVSGGEQTLRYELVGIGLNTWEVRASMWKGCFEDFVVVEDRGIDCEDPSGRVTVLQCSPESQISRRTSIRFELNGGSVHADVCSFTDETRMLDRCDKPMVVNTRGTSLALQQSWGTALFQRARSVAQLLTLRPEVFRCALCRRRARGVAATAVAETARLRALPGMAAIPSESRGTADDDLEGAMRAPLRGATVQA